MSHEPLNSARRPAGLWVCGQRKCVAHKPHSHNSNSRSGHMMCYKPRTSSRATDRGKASSMCDIRQRRQISKARQSAAALMGKRCAVCSKVGFEHRPDTATDRLTPVVCDTCTEMPK
jgi:hypothetical protein